MNHVRALLSDRRRSQKGSVLSGVLIITAFIAIIAGALMTELSTNFVVSSDLMNRISNEATVSSAMELSLGQLQTTQLNSPCPSLFGPYTLNGRTAVATYTSCWPTIDARTTTQFQQSGSPASPFNLDGVHVVAGAMNDYLVGDSGGNLFDYRFGSIAPRWTLALGGSVTGPPLVIPDPGTTSFIDAIPMSGPACSALGGYCIYVLTDANTTSPPTHKCTIGTTSPMTSQPGASVIRPGYVYYWTGTSLRISDLSGGDCDAVSSVSVSGSVVAGPIVFRCASGCGNGNGNVDDLYAIVSGSSSSQLDWFTFNGNNLGSAGSVPLSWGGASGVSASGSTLPASLALSFGGGQLAVVGLGSNGLPALKGSTPVPAGIADAPDWCAICGNQIGVGARDGGLYVYDSGLNLLTSISTGSPISTSPAVDGSGNWYVGTDDGYVHEVQNQSGQGLVQLNRYGPMAQFGSSAVVGACPVGICIYAAARNGNRYLVSLDARDVVLWACLTSAPPACSGANPRLWAKVELGVGGNPKAVHVQGWSYYSP